MLDNMDEKQIREEFAKTFDPAACNSKLRIILFLDGK